LWTYSENFILCPQNGRFCVLAHKRVD